DPFHRVRTEVPVQIVADEAGDGPSLFAAGGEGKDPCVREGLCGGDQFVPGFGDREVVFLEERLVVPDPLDVVLEGQNVEASGEVLDRGDGRGFDPVDHPQVGEGLLEVHHVPGVGEFLGQCGGVARGVEHGQVALAGQQLQLLGEV